MVCRGTAAPHWNSRRGTTGAGKRLQPISGQAVWRPADAKLSSEATATGIQYVVAQRDATTIFSKSSKNIEKAELSS